LCEERVSEKAFTVHSEICSLRKSSALEIYNINAKLEKYLKVIRNYSGSLVEMEDMKKVERRTEKYTFTE
jgi:hypothetical protein